MTFELLHTLKNSYFIELMVMAVNLVKNTRDAERLASDEHLLVNPGIKLNDTFSFKVSRKIASSHPIS